LANPLPENLLPESGRGEILLSDADQASLWFGSALKSPKGSILHTASWVYALAAPFPTLTDNVTLADLRSFWRGFRIGGFSNVSKLYVSETIVNTLDDRWKPHDPEIVKVVSSLPSIEKLWEENAWAIIPFETLNPRLKVIRLSGSSPLDKAFEPDTYPLTLQFVLTQTQTDAGEMKNADLQSLIDSIPLTNRDPEKMTTLVMTGVTALVRATAYKMEVKGVQYPGEEIREWLSEADLTHISNEVSFYEKCPFPNPNSRSLLFCSDPKYIELFEYIGADIIELTGNHNNDSLYTYGEDVVPYTLDLYQQRGMDYYGGGLNLADAQSPLILTHNGNQIAFIGCNAPGPDFAWATEDQGGAAPCGDYQWLVDEIRQLKQDGILPIVTLQYYEDYYNFPESHHIKDFGQLAEAGAIIVNGSQAHRPKGMAFTQNTFIDYGLGNLFFDQMGIIDDYGRQILQTRWEIIQRHTFFDGHHLSTELLTAMLEDYAQPRPMTDKERRQCLEELFAASEWDFK
ncbi:MAG: CapA family protein, partial [Chloroflexota bacterium]|nr:CapA family protein [Chloroflexota bacterium]